MIKIMIKIMIMITAQSRTRLKMVSSRGSLAILSPLNRLSHERRKIILGPDRQKRGALPGALPPEHSRRR